ncbi:MAG: hypothetical protein SVK08_02445 [Halobacteriota archaeon]|nr:hypothetical protein [Halobacteriota archaeon]
MIEKIVTSYDVSRKLAGVLGTDVPTYFVWVDGENGPQLMTREEYLNRSHYGHDLVPAYTVTELAAICGGGAMSKLRIWSAVPDIVAERAINAGLERYKEQALDNLRKWQES